MFKELTTIEEINTIVHTEKLTFLYIHQPNCSVCNGLFPQIMHLLEDFPEVRTFKVDATRVPALAGTYQVFAAPTLLFFVNGKEYIREARFVQTKLLKENINKIITNLAFRS